MNRVLLYVHFNRHDKLSDYVLYQLQQIRSSYSKVIFITNSKISSSDKERLIGLYDGYIQRENIGFDFAAWRDGIESIGWGGLSKYDSLTLMNDTCFGPVYPMEEVYEAMEQRDGVDFWGLTEHDANIVGMPGTNGYIPFHIQSYMQVFNINVIKSKVFQKFWSNIQDYKDVTKVIQEYETQLTSILKDAGFSCNVFFDTQKYSVDNNIVDIQNYSEFLPLVIMKNKVPLVKIKSFIHTPTKRIMRVIRKTQYPPQLIVNELKERNVISMSAGKYFVKNNITRTANLLRKSPTVKRIVKKSPKTVRVLKKVQRRLFGEYTAPVVTPERKKEYLVKQMINANLERNYAEHMNLLQSNKIYWHENESPSIYKRANGDPRVVAIYLPQFHPFEENDKAWGKGFTEWTNVTAITPKFVGQQQPVLPSDLGFYDLRLPEIMKQQIDLAKKYGVYGFQFYYYWFSGKKVMETPINTILKNKDWDFNFSICWANENWTKKWDGGDKDIIFEQKNDPEDPLKFIKDVAPILNDPRYIQENGKPILTVYRVDLLDDAKRYADIWRDYFKKEFGKELWLIGCTNFKNFDPSDVGFDATMDFTPTGSSSQELKPWVDDRKFLNDIYEGKLLDGLWSGMILDFRFIAKMEIQNLSKNRNDYKTISPSWSNEARRKGIGGFTFQKSSPEIFANWLDKVIDFEINTKNKKQPLVFVNAWNEWAESAMIEPSQHLGHNSLRRIAEVVSKYSNNKANTESFPAYGFQYAPDAKLAVVLHLFYPNMINVFRDKLKKINVPFDLYISLPSEYNNIKIDKINEFHKNTNIVSVPNRGRDVLPFITIANRIRKLNNYEYVLKLHTKKSLHRKDGDVWLVSLLDTLIPDDASKIIKVLSKRKTGVVGPGEHLVSLSQHMGSNEAFIRMLLKQIVEDGSYSLDKKKNPFIGGTMFWSRLDLLDPLLDLYLLPEDFQPEEAQIDGTIAHALERMFGMILHDIQNKEMYLIDKTGNVSKVEDKTYDEGYKYAR